MAEKRQLSTEVKIFNLLAKEFGVSTAIALFPKITKLINEEGLEWNLN